MWEAARALREKAMMLRQVAQLDRRAGDAAGADTNERRAGQYDEQASVLRGLVREGAGADAGVASGGMGEAADRKGFR